MSNDFKKVSLYVDIENKDEILSYLSQDDRHKKKWSYIAGIILNGGYNGEHYCKVEINKQCKDVTEIRFFPGQENDRIYCKEIHTKDGTKVIVTSILHERKKTTKLSSKEKSAIQKVGGYEYEIE